MNRDKMFSGQEMESARLPSILKYVGVSRENIAAEIGVSINSLNNWCSGRAHIKLEHLSRLVLALRDRGAPVDLLSGFLAAELVRYGMAPEAVGFINKADKRLEAHPYLVLGSNLYSGFYEPITLGVYDAMRKMGIRDVAYLDTCGSEEVLDFYISVALRSPLRGVIIVGLRMDEHELQKVSGLASQLATRQIPCVFVAAGLDLLPPQTGMVRTDGYSAAAMATQTLLGRGHRNIVALALTPWPGQRTSLRGYYETMQTYGRAGSVVWARASNSGPVSSAFGDVMDLQQAADLVASDPEVTALLALSSSFCKAVLRALHSRGRVPGRDISLIALGCWDWMHNVATPPVTHVALPYHEAGRQAANLLLALATRRLSPQERWVTVPLPDKAFHAGPEGTLTSISSGDQVRAAGI